MISNCIKKLINNSELEFLEVQEVIREMTEGRAGDLQISAFLTALAIKGATTKEILAAATVLQEKRIPFNCDFENVVDLVGTGGDYLNTFNITTAAAFCASGAGCKIAKHGNRSGTSKAGAADVLEELGANINLSAEKSLEIFKKTGVCFLFAQKYNPCMKHVAKVRSEIGFRTLFNILGPLINPAGTKMQLIGVYDEKLCRPVAEVLVELGIVNGMVVYGKDGLDEASTVSPTVVCEIKNSKIETYELCAEDFGIKKAVISDIKGGSANDNARIIKDIFSGREKGAKYDITVFNAALVLYIAKIADNLTQAVQLAKSSIDNGFAKKKLEEFIYLSKGNIC